jgi:AraC-like DNA-binding protein
VDPLRDEPPGGPPQRDHGGHDAPAGEVARYWRHAAVPGVDLLRATFVTHRYARHTHETYTLALIEDGVEEFRYGASLLRAGRGAVALLNPEMVHTGQAGVPEGWSYRVLYPAVSVVREVSAELTGSAGTPFFPDTVVDDPRSARLVRAAHLAAEHGDPLASAGLLHAALAGLLREHSRAGRRSRPREARPAVRTAVSLLRERVTDPPTLGELAVATGVGPFALMRAFRAETGLPPHAYLNQLRVRQARQLLDCGVPPAQAAAEAGFADQAHLTRHFKRVVGVPPGAYQRARQGRGGSPGLPGQGASAGLAGPPGRGALRSPVVHAQ